ncbi:MAG: BatD family protein [Chloroherpetonaceae bacterium]|nr:BatD family protein [Chloroherpetonaceae bacterium]
MIHHRFDIASIRASILLLIFLSLPNLLYAQVSVKATVDNPNLVLGEPFSYTVEVQGNANFNEVQLGKTQVFEVMQGRVSQSSSFSIVNGRVSQSKSLSYLLIPRKEGRQTIPAATVDIGGTTYTSNSIDVVVSKGAAQAPAQNKGGKGNEPTLAADQAFIRPLVSKTKLFVGEAALVTYKLYFRINIIKYEQTQDIKPDGFWIEKFDLGNNSPSTTEYYNGAVYRVAVINKMIVFPTRAGALEISPYSATCEVLQRDLNFNRGVVPQNLFQFFNSMGSTSTIPIKVYSPSIKFTVSPTPEPKPLSFNGAVGKYNFTATMSKTQVKVGEPVTFKIAIEGEGNIPTLSDIAIPFPSSFEAYPPDVKQKKETTTGSLIGSRTQEVVVVPRSEGHFDLGELEFSYFNPSKKSYITLKSNRFELDVLPDPNAVFSTTSPFASATGEINFIKPNSETLTRIGKPIYLSFWFFGLLLLPLIAYIGVGIIQKRDEKLQTDVAFARSFKASPEAKKRLKAALDFKNKGDQKGFFGELEHALIKYIGDRFNTDTFAFTNTERRAFLESKGIDSELIEKCISTLDMAAEIRYAPEGMVKADLDDYYDRTSIVITELSKKK